MPDETPRETADASWLVNEPAESPQPETPPSAAEPAGSYEVEPVDETAHPEPEPAPTPIPTPPPARPAAATPQPSLRPEEAVPQVWTRGAEWGPDLMRMGLVALGVAWLVWISFDLANPAPALGLLLLGMVALAVLSYPLVITLERPVRMTPEQAVRDYFQALAHHVPHVRRMWLLLSAKGRISGEFGSYDGFRRYWTRRLAELRGDRVSAVTPLVFQIDAFRSERGEDRQTAEARFEVVVFARGRRSAGPISTIPMTLTLARGADNQWYLDRGTLPEP
jgi:hypothetical protein